MKLVLDSCVAVKWVIPEAGDAKARQLRDEFSKTVHELLAPDVFTSEIAHALMRAERQGRILTGEALRLWLDVMTTPPQFHSSALLTPRAIEMSSKSRIGFYDCLYVARAERKGCELITSDDKLIKNLQSSFPFIMSLDSVP